MSKKTIKIKEAKTMSDKQAQKGLEDISKNMFKSQPKKKLPPPIDLFTKKVTKNQGFPKHQETGSRLVPEEATKQAQIDLKKLEPMSQDEILNFFEQLLSNVKNAWDLDYSYYLYTVAFDLLDKENNRDIPAHIRRTARQKNLEESKKITMDRIKSLVREELKKGK